MPDSFEFFRLFIHLCVGIPPLFGFVRSYAHLHPTYLSYAHLLDPIIAWHCWWNSGPYLRWPDRNLQINSPLTHQPQSLCCSFSRIQPLLESSVATLLRNWKRAQNRAFECCCRYSPPVLGNYPLPHWLVCKMLSFAKHWILGCKKD